LRRRQSRLLRPSVAQQLQWLSPFATHALCTARNIAKAPNELTEDELALYDPFG
jgi:hypothetical protein